MVRIGNWILFEKKKTTVERFRGSVDKGVSGKTKRKIFHLGQHTWTSRCKHFDDLAEQYPLFDKACLSLAGIVMSQGVYLAPAVKKDDKTYPLAEEAVYRIEHSPMHRNINGKMYDTVLKMAKYGACFWEVTKSPEFGFRVAPSQEYIEPRETDDVGNVIKPRANVNAVLVKYSNPNVMDFHYIFGITESNLEHHFIIPPVNNFKS